MSHELSTERLLLRGLEMRDDAALFAIFSDPETVAFTEWEPFKTMEEAHWLIRWATSAAEEQPRTVFAWGIQWREADDAALVGIVTLTVRNPSQREASIGYMVNRADWGRDIASEAARAVIHAAFHDLHLHRVTGACRPENTASARVLEKVGMRREGHRRQNIWEKGRWRDSAIFAVLEDEMMHGTPSSSSGVCTPLEDTQPRFRVNRRNICGSI